MAQAKKFTWGAAGFAVLLVAAALTLWIMPSRQTSSAQDGPRPVAPLITRGYTDAPAGTALIAGDPAGGGVLIELKIADGQKVKHDEVIAVLSNYPKADIAVRTTEAELAKTRQAREAMVSGYRAAEIAMQEVVVKSTAEEVKLKNLEITGNIVCVYAALSTGLITLFAAMIIPDAIRPKYVDNLLGGLAMHLAGPEFLRLGFHVFVVAVGVLILAGAVNTSMIGGNGSVTHILGLIACSGISSPNCWAICLPQAPLQLSKKRLRTR